MQLSITLKKKSLWNGCIPSSKQNNRNNYFNYSSFSLQFYHSMLWRFSGIIQWIICEWRCPSFNLLPPAIFRSIKENKRWFFFSLSAEIPLQSLSVSPGKKGKKVSGLKTRLRLRRFPPLSRLSYSQTTSFPSPSLPLPRSFLHKQLTSSAGAGCVGDKDQQCGLYSGLPAGINHCQDASDPLKPLFSWVLEITSCESSKEQDVPDKDPHCLLSFPKTSPPSAPEEMMLAFWKPIPQHDGVSSQSQALRSLNTGGFQQ